IASSLIFLYCFTIKESLKFKLKDHFFLFLLGAGMFSIHCLLIYEAAFYLVSAIVCLLFSCVSLFNILNSYLFFRSKPEKQVLIGAGLGVIGIALFFWEEAAQFKFSEKTIYGASLALSGSYVFSLGNLLGKRNQTAGFKLVPSVAWGMLYGSLIMFFYSFFKHVPFDISYKASYWISLMYLAIPGSIVAFLSYLKLIERIGPEKTGYATVLFPVIALLISIAVEGYTPSYYDLIGMCLIFLGNILVMAKPCLFQDITSRLKNVLHTQS
ncbi:MAG: DMT family transporter, partial [Parachlamydiaceae bacterium]